MSRRGLTLAAWCLAVIVLARVLVLIVPAVARDMSKMTTYDWLVIFDLFKVAVVFFIGYGIMVWLVMLTRGEGL